MATLKQASIFLAAALFAVEDKVSVKAIVFEGCFTRVILGGVLVPARVPLPRLL